MHNYICDTCGAYLDPGERCTCHETHEKNLRMVDELLEPDADGQMTLKEILKPYHRNHEEIEHERKNYRVVEKNGKRWD